MDDTNRDRTGWTLPYGRDDLRVAKSLRDAIPLERELRLVNAVRAIDGKNQQQVDRLTAGANRRNEGERHGKRGQEGENGS